MKWLKQTLANVAGTAEPEYGASAVASVNEQTKEVSYTELTKEDLKWKAMNSTCVETQTFYFFTDAGEGGLVQFIYSNVSGVRTTCTFNTKIYNYDGPGKHLWCTDTVTGQKFDKDKYSFFSDKSSITLSEDGNTYHIISTVNPECTVDLTITKAAPGFKVGKDGTTYFGTDLTHPWGSMRHFFWPRCNVTGSMTTKARTLDFKGRALYIFALQGMKPHHLAARWNFCAFQTPKYSAVLIEFTTPASYGKTVVSVGGIATEGKLIWAGPTTAKHLAAKPDTDGGVNWPEPKAVMFQWSGKNKEGQTVNGEVQGELHSKSERIDVMANIPAVVKSVAGVVSGARPYIYQTVEKGQLSLILNIDGKEEASKGDLIFEATFISAI